MCVVQSEALEEVTSTLFSISVSRRLDQYHWKPRLLIIVIVSSFVSLLFLLPYLCLRRHFRIKLQEWDATQNVDIAYNSNGLLSLEYYHSLGDRVCLRSNACRYFFLSLVFCGLVALGSLSWIREYTVLVFKTAQQESLSNFDTCPQPFSEARQNYSARKFDSQKPLLADL